MHGHLYVAVSRVRTHESVRIVALPEQCSQSGIAFTRNIVWPELLLPENTVACGRECVRKRPASALDM